MKRKDKYRSHCPINFSQEAFGDKWSLLIIRDLMFMGKRYYGDFLKSDEKISTNILASRLEKLEAEGLITKTPDQDNRSKIKYALASKGIDLMPLLLEMIVWGAKYDNKTVIPAEFVHRIKTDKNSFILELLDKLEG